MEIGARMRQIFLVLLNQKEPVSVQEVAEQIGKSKRTVQRELEYAKQSLKGYDLTFHSKTGVGVWLEGNEEEKERLKRELSEADGYDGGDREERRKRLTLEILKEKGLKKLFYYSSQFQVSEATIRTDLEVVGKWLEKFDLHVGKKPGSGVVILGEEENYRKALRAFIQENIDTKAVREAYEYDREDALKKSGIGKILNDEVMCRVMDCLRGMNHTKVLTLTENSYVGLVIHISIAINRILKGEVIESNAKWQEELSKDEDYRLAEEIVEELEEEFEIQIPDVEISYICLHIKGSKHEKVALEGTEVLDLENREVQQLLNQMIDAFDEKAGYLLKQDDEFLQGLLAHLQPTFVRLKHNMQIQNPVLDDIKKEYPDLFEKCVRVGNVLGEKLNCPVPEEEIGFLTVHFGAALVRLEGQKEQIRRVEIGVVCSSGIGISRLMSSKLEKQFGDRVRISTYGKNDITPYIVSNTDFFITSIPMEKSEIPVIDVSPLLNETDMERIRRMVYQYERMPAKKEEETFFDELTRIHQIAVQIRTVIEHLDIYEEDSAIGFQQLVEQIAKRCSPYQDRQEKIYADIMRREEIATQVYAEFGFALLHNRSEGVVRPTLAVCLPGKCEKTEFTSAERAREAFEETKRANTDFEEMKHGPNDSMKPEDIRFTDPYMKGISAVFVMLVPVDEHLQINNEILGYISTMLIEDFEFMEIVEQKEKEEIREAITKNLKKYFQKIVTEVSGA